MKMMNKKIILIALVLMSIHAGAQEVDLVRLGYTKSEITSEQIGMTASVDGRLIAFVFKDKVIRIFDVQAGRFVKRFTGPFSNLFDLQLTNDGKLVMLEKNQVVIIDVKSEKTLNQFTTSAEITKSSYLSTYNVLAVGQREGWVTVYDLNQINVINTFQYKKHHVSALALHPNGKSVVVGVIPSVLVEMNPLRLYEIKSGKVLAESKRGSYPMAVYDEKGDRLVASVIAGTGLKTSVETFEGNTLVVMKEVESKALFGNAIMPHGGRIFQNRLLAITASLSFNVYEIQTGGISFTTKSDGFKMPSPVTMGVGNALPFPLGNGRFLINSLGNNINQVYDINSNSIIGYFFCDSNDDFAIVSRDGRVEGTPEALSKVFWTARSSMKRSSLESTSEKGFTPRLLSQLISKEDLQQAAFEVDKVVEKIPVIQLKSVNGKASSANVQFTSSQKVTKVEVAVTQNALEVTEIKLFQNSKLIKVVPGSGKASYVMDVSLTNSFGEQNYFYATAGSKTGIESEKVKFTIIYKGATEARPRLFLVTIGIDKYRNPKYNLNYAQADADGVAKVISQKSKTLFQEIIPFAIRNDKAIKTNIYAALEQIKTKALEQDMIIVYYAGHGVMSGGSNKEKEFFIVPHDVTQMYGKDELLFEKAISAEDLKKYAQAINAQKQVFILDACQSAGALESLGGSRGVAEEKAIAHLARSTGTCWITSTGSDQFASEFAKLGHGIFTYTLLEGMNGAADVNKDQRLTIRELSTYIENKVPELSEQLKGTSQFPSAYSFGNDFPIAVFGN